MRVWLPPPVYTRARARTHTHTHTFPAGKNRAHAPPLPAPAPAPAPFPNTRRLLANTNGGGGGGGGRGGTSLGSSSAGSEKAPAPCACASWSPSDRAAGGGGRGGCRGFSRGADVRLRGGGAQASRSHIPPTYPPYESRRSRRRRRRRRRRRWAPCCAGAPARRGTGGRRACAPPWPGARRRACRVSGEGRGGAGGRRDLEVGDELHDFGVALDGALLLPCPLLCVLLHDPGKSIFIQFQGLVLLLDDDLLHPFCPLADSLCRGIVSAAGAVTDRSQRRNFSWSYLGTSLNLLCFTSAAFMAASFASLYQ